MLFRPTSPHIAPPKPGWTYVQSETGTLFQSQSIKVIEQKVSKHRKAMGLDLSQGWVERLHHELCLQNTNIKCEPDRFSLGFVSPLVEEGRRLWGQLHGHADSLTPENFNQENVKTWLRLWEDRIPRFSGCRCHEGYLQAISENPIDTSSPERFRAWCVIIHDAINVRLGKPKWDGVILSPHGHAPQAESTQAA